MTTARTPGQGLLSEAQRALLVARLRQGRQDPPSTGIPRRDPALVEIPLSSGQEQLWFIDQLAPGRPTYNIAGGVRIGGRLDVDALRSALGGVTARHEILRTRHVSVDGRPHQVVDPPRVPELSVVDVVGSTAEQRENRWRELADGAAARGFALATGPLFRVLLLRLTDHDHVLVVVVHHTVFDGGSFPVLLRELAALYEAAVTGRPAQVPEPPIQFGDFAVWERDRLRGELLDQLVEYWRETLDAAPVLQLPTDRPRPLLQTYDGAIERQTIDRPLLDALRALGRTGSTTLFVTLLAAYAVLLHRYSGQDDIVVGTVSANRGRPELADLIGYLINTLPVRVDLSGDPAFAELLPRVHATVVGAYAHQDLSFAAMVGALRVPRDPSRSPLFQAGFMLSENQQRQLQVGELTWVSEELETRTAKFDLVVNAVEADGELTLQAGYATALFDGATVRRMLGHFRVLLEGIAEDPGRPLSRLPLMSAAELRRELVEWNATDVPYPSWCLHERFEAQAQATPDLVAARLGDDTITYAELNASANRIARRLRELGVSAEVLVGVCMESSARRLAGLLGILKAGGGYVPLDPQYPVQRLSFMLRDADVAVILTDDASAAALPEQAPTVVSLDRDWPSLSALDDTNLPAVANPSNIAYVIYTSGSTGQPKGVVIEHRQAVNFATGEIEHWPLGPGDRVLQFASLNFDVSVLDIFGALLSGATLVLGSRETLLSPPRLADLIRGEGITFMCLPPAVLTLLADEQFPALRVVLAGGEALSSALVRAWARPGLRFINAYGPTETTVGATMAECRAGGPDIPPIGLPLPNYRAYVLDRQLNPVPVGVTGELHIGGAGVARGYLNRPELTAGRFIPDPFRSEPDRRMYKTGDIVRRLPDGNLQFLGRYDDQVKIRGLRVELGEIEAVLADHPSVAQAVVAVGVDRAGQKQLIGYVRTEPEAPATTPADLKVHLAGRLPAYMVPAHLLILDAFPLNANGKVDRSALPTPDNAEGAAAYVAPRTLAETVLVDLYAGLLNLEQVGVDDNFFDLGGNSLQAMQMITRLRTELEADVDVTAIFLAPTPAQFAVLLRERYGVVDQHLHEAGLEHLGEVPDDAATTPPASTRATLDEVTSAAVLDGPGTPLPAAAPVGTWTPLPRQPVVMSNGAGERPLFCVHAVGGTVYGYAHLAHGLADRFRTYGIEAAGLRDGEGTASDLDDMVTRYVDTVRAVQPAGPYWLAGWSMGGLVALEMARRIEASGDLVSLVALLDVPVRPADVTAMPDAELTGHFIADAARTLGAQAGKPPDPAVTEAAHQLRWLADKLASGAGDSAAMRVEIGRRFEVFKAHLRLIGGHRPAPVNATTLVINACESDDCTGEWSALLGPSSQVARVPGDHYSLLQPPAVHDLVAVLRARIDALAGATDRPPHAR